MINKRMSDEDWKVMYGEMHRVMLSGVPRGKREQERQKLWKYWVELKL